MYRYKDLTPFCKHLPDYDCHKVYGLVDDRGRPILGIFVHRVGKIKALNGSIATCGGGIRWWWEYATDMEVFTVGLRTSTAMSQKSAGLKVSLGGAKTIIFPHNIPGWVTDQHGVRTWPWHIREAIWRAMAEEVMPHIPGYVTAEDVGTQVKDVACIKQYAPWAHVAGSTEQTDSSPTTVDGMMIALETTLYAYCNMFLGWSDIRVAVQGVGNVGGGIVGHLRKGGAHDLAISDFNPKRLETLCEKYGSLHIVPTDRIHREPVDVFMPCGLGGTLNTQTIPELNALMVVGCANNQLAEFEDGMRMHERGILWAPDYIANAGGMVMVNASTVTGGSIPEMLKIIGENLEEIFADSKKYNLPTSRIADELAAGRIKKFMSLPQ
ncbi:hypothetical protein HY413_03660 [Candidatus Kaiserbacteria bacterium]|nr:hypothetical protein [Candidatus Kaiserbacteria bacterium]